MTESGPNATEPFDRRLNGPLRVCSTTHVGTTVLPDRVEVS